MTPARLVWPGSWVGHIPFASWLVGVLRPRLLVELGTHSGNSYCGFCQAIVDQAVQGRAYAVDTWEGDSHAGQYDSSVLEALAEYHDPLYGGFSTLLRLTFDEALGRFEDGSIDLLHIDGLHTYEAVLHDFESWLPKLSQRAVVLFHDTAVHRDDFGVFRLWDELKQRYPGFEFRHSNGLGVLLVGDHVPAALRQLVESEGAGQPDGLARPFFEALGLRLEQQTELLDREVIVRAREEEVERLTGVVAHRDRDVTELRLAVEARDEQIAMLGRGRPADQAEIHRQVLARAAQLEEQLAVNASEAYALALDRDAHAAQLAAVQSSLSWRITAPLRLAGLLARGQFSDAGRRVAGWSARVPHIKRGLVSRARARLARSAAATFDIEVNHASHDALVDERNAWTRDALQSDPITASAPASWPRVDLSVVTFNSARWVDCFVDSLAALEYPKDRLTLRFVDNQSSDETVAMLKSALPRLQGLGIATELLRRPNRGFGAGHNAGLAGGAGEFCLVTNIDLEFVPDALARVVSMAVADSPMAVAWEFRQKPYEHPKFYDPVTGTTNWNSHACVLLRRSAFETVGGYDDKLFMYGEDVELSYRLRRNGGVLRYCPRGVVMHYSYSEAGEIKPLQYTGSTFANLYLRLKYGSRKNSRAVPMMGLGLLLAPAAYPGSRWEVFRSLLRLAVKAPAALMQRKKSDQAFAFREWDYEMAREGAFIEARPLPQDCPLVSVVTRTYRGRDRFLRQAILSVAHQTYPNIEHVIVEDGQEMLRSVVEEAAAVTGLRTRYLAIEKAGRSAAGNAGLAVAQGRWCVFLDDDDLLFADHVETLVQALQQAPQAVAAYSPAIEVATEYPSEPGASYGEIGLAVPSPLKQPFDVRILRHHNFMAIQSVLFERRLFLERGGFELDMHALEDWVLWNVYACRNNFVYVPKATSLFRTPSSFEARARRNAVFGEAYELARERIARRLMEVNSHAMARGVLYEPPRRDATERPEAREAAV